MNSGIDVANLRAYDLRSGGCSSEWPSLFNAPMMRDYIVPRLAGAKTSTLFEWFGCLSVI